MDYPQVIAPCICAGLSIRKKGRAASQRTKTASMELQKCLLAGVRTSVKGPNGTGRKVQKTAHNKPILMLFRLFLMGICRGGLASIGAKQGNTDLISAEDAGESTLAAQGPAIVFLSSYRNSAARDQEQSAVSFVPHASMLGTSIENSSWPHKRLPGVILG
jgi:hypothetical protein